MGLETRFSAGGEIGVEGGRKEAGARMKTVVVAGTSSGVGKTTIAVGLMAAFTRRGLRVQPFKVGPDFLDPMHHKAATGRESFNLDGWMLSREVNLACFMRYEDITDIAIVEGVMGLYDGRDGKSEVGSTAEMAKLLGAPVVLVLDCWALARSAAAMIRGYTCFDKDLTFAGVIFNKVGGSRHTAWLSEAVQTTEHAVRILGGVPKASDIEIPERHLGLHMPEDSDLPRNYIDKLADLIEQNVDLDAILKAAEFGSPVDGREDVSDRSGHFIIAPILPKQVRVGVAQDAAFCFYYHENLAQLQDAGAELVFFSPLKDLLPPSLDAIYFGGGYPELHGKQLSANKPMLYAVKAFADAGGVVYGECGGLMYLSQGIEGRDGVRHMMCGVFPFWTRMQTSMHMGYVTVRPLDSSVIFPADVGQIRGQMYHFSEIVDTDPSSMENCTKGFSVRFEYANAVEELEGYMCGNAMATYVHLHFGSNPAVAYSFIQCCRMDPTRAAAVAAASASAVADAGPAAAAAAGAAAAAAVADALWESRSFHNPDVAMYVEADCRSPGSMFSEEFAAALSENVSNGAMTPTPNIFNLRSKSLSEEQVSKHRQSEIIVRRWGSFDLGRNGRIADPRKFSGQIAKSESEFSLTGPLKSRNGRHVARTLSFSDSSSNDSLEGNGARSLNRGIPVNQAREGNDLSEDRCRDIEITHSASLLDGVQQQRPSTSGTGTNPIICNGTGHKEAFATYFLGGLYGNSTSKAGAPKRILSLLPSATEILMTLGAGDRLLGVTDLCDKPAGVSDDRHIVCRSKIDTTKMSSKEVEAAMKAFMAEKTSPFTLDEAWIASTKPDLVLTQDTCEQCDIDSSEVATVLARAGLVNGENTTVIVLRPYTVAEVLATVLQIGKAVGLYAEASLQVKELRTRLRRVATAVARRERPSVMLLQGLDPFVLGGHWVPDMENLAGGQDDLQRIGCDAERLYWPRIVSYAPEVLILAPCSSSLERTLSEVSIVARQPGFWTIPAVESRRVYICEHSYFSRPSASIVDGIELLAHILHPEAGIPLKLQDAALQLSLKRGQKCKPYDLAKHFKPLE